MCNHRMIRDGYLARSIATKIHPLGPFVQRISNLNDGPCFKKNQTKTKQPQFPRRSLSHMQVR